MKDFGVLNSVFLSFIYERVEAGKIIMVYLFTRLIFVIETDGLSHPPKDSILRHQEEKAAGLCLRNLQAPYLILIVSSTHVPKWS